MTVTIDPELLETAAIRRFKVYLQSKPGLKPPALMEVKVEAFSLREAKLNAIKAAAQKKFQHRKHMGHWLVEVEEVHE